MSKSYYSLGLMSGTSMDGVDASIIHSDGKTKYKAILDKYFEYPKSIYKNLTTLRDEIKGPQDLKKHQKQIKSVEKEITIFHAESVNKILKKTIVNVDFLGFHGQTIFHNAKEKISKQLGDGKLLSKLTKKNVVYDFRQNDLKNGGNGAPLTPIFHKLLKEKFKIEDACFVNIGGIINTTDIWRNDYMSGSDLGPGMCLLDKWIRINTKQKFDNYGKISKLGKVNKIVFEKLKDNLYKKEQEYFNNNPHTLSYDIKDFDLSIVQGLSLEDGAATLLEFTVSSLYSTLKIAEKNKNTIILCGGGRRNTFLVEKLQEDNNRLKLIEEFGIDGDFVESQAFGYLAIRSYLKLPISFPETTGCIKPCTGGVIVKNF